MHFVKLNRIRPFRIASPLVTSRFMGRRSITCQIDAEPLHRYSPGGYHPVHLGDFLGDGRYKVIHKLGWGGYSTVWAARDRKSSRNVAVKVNVSSSETACREQQLLRNLTTDNSCSQTGSTLMHWIDDFEVEGPNGKHVCIVTELLGPSISDFLDTQNLKNGRLSAPWAKNIAKQLLAALTCVHQRGIGHGDVHTRNIIIKDDKWDCLSEAELLSNLGKPETAEIVSEDSSDPSLPRYVVRPSSLPVETSKVPDIRLIDFGEAFTIDNKSHTLHTPLALRAPEVLFEDEWDHRVDLWSAGCIIFELLTGQPPFDTIMTTKDILIGQMVEEIGPLPDRWAAKWQAKESDRDDERYSLAEWLFELYFDEGKEGELTRQQLEMWANVIKSLMRFEPGDRVSAADVLQDSCFS